MAFAKQIAKRDDFLVLKKLICKKLKKLFCLKMR